MSTTVVREHESNGLLEKGEYWEPAKSPPTIGDRLSRWGIEIAKPEFLRKPTGPLKNRKTAYLDGLRGFAALLVYFHHNELWSHGSHPTGNKNSIFENGWGYDGEYHIINAHFLRTFFSGGHFSVTVFFVLSGYVLSMKPLTLIHSGEHAKLVENLGSALFRRWLRLFLPIIATTLIYATIMHVFPFWIGAHTPKSTYREELWEWYLEFKQWSFVFRQGGEPWFTYNFHSWSIPVEFKGSIVVYTSTLALSRCTRNKRLLCMLALMFYFTYIVDGWFCTLFIGGMLLCDLDLLSARGELPEFLNKMEPYKTFIYYHFFAIALFLGGVPSSTFDVNDLVKSHGWAYLRYLKPHAVYDYKWFYLIFASVLQVACTRHISWLKAFFESRFCQYLGRISFSLYLVHGPVIWILADRVYAAVGYARDVHVENVPGWVNRFPLPFWGPLGMEFNFVVCTMFLLPLTLWLAEICTKAIDEPSVRFAQRVYKWTLPAPDEGWKPGR